MEQLMEQFNCLLEKNKSGPERECLNNKHKNKSGWNHP